MLAHMTEERIAELKDHTKRYLITAANLPIDRLGERKGVLIELVHLVVDTFTDGGKLTADTGNEPLDCMPWWDDLNTFLFLECGFQRLGNGHFSAAYSHSMLPNQVIKVGFKKEDSGAAYAAFCRANDGMQGLPTIYNIQRSSGCYSVLMDKYDVFRWEETTEEQDDQFRLVRYTVECGVTYKSLLEAEYIEEDTDLMRSLHATALKINEFFVGIAEFDMHSGNVMLDSNGRLVITDPVSFTCEEEE